MEPSLLCRTLIQNPNSCWHSRPIVFFWPVSDIDICFKISNSTVNIGSQKLFATNSFKFLQPLQPHPINLIQVNKAH